MKTNVAPFDVRSLIRSALKVADPIARQFTYPLFAVDARDRPDLYASRVLLELDGKSVLITAAHAVFEICSARSAVHVGTTSGITALSDFVSSSPDGRDPLDIAALRLPDELLSAMGTPFQCRMPP